MQYKTADLCDQYGALVAVCEPMFRSYGKRRTFAGPIATLKVSDDNVLVRTALETLPAGTVLVVDGHGSRRSALLGDNLARIGAERGLAGVIIYGCVRDTAELEQIDLGILAIAAMPRRSKKEGRGEENTALQFGGIQWQPGYYAYADEDGVVVAPERLI